MDELVAADVAERLRGAGCVFAEDEAELLIDAASGPALAALVDRRVAGEPLEQLLGWAEFCGLRVGVAPDVFVPRRRSELLVRIGSELVSPESVVVELCCGTAAVSLALLASEPSLAVHAADVSSAAVACARANLAGRAEVHLGDLYDALPRELAGSVALIVANAPYVPTAELPFMPVEARDHEPVTALDGGPDGVAIHRRIAASASAWLAPGGHLLIETSDRQAALTAAAYEAGGLTSSVINDADLDATAVLGMRPIGSDRSAARISRRSSGSA